MAEHLFRESLENYTIHQVVPDIGIIQHDALNSDLPATIEALDRLLPFSVELIQILAEKVQGCSCILCDIAPLGIVVAEAAGIPSVLVENLILLCPTGNNSTPSTTVFLYSPANRST